jgi:Na+-driven multidrug efflux pump
MSFPIIIASDIIQNILPNVSIYFVGNLGSDELATFALASTW